MNIAPAIKWHGGKSYLARRIIELMPARAANPNAPAAEDPGYLHYVEPFFGGGAVLWANDPQGVSEVVNDLDHELMSFWSVLRSEELFARFVRQVQAMPCHETEFEIARQNIGDMEDAVDSAVAFFVINRQSRQALGKDFATIVRNRTRRGMNELPSAWLSAIEGLPEVHARLKRVVILNDYACNVIQQQDGPRTLFYVDPPYLAGTRYNGGGEYRHEMTDAEHASLLGVLSCINGRFILSGYRNEMYDAVAKKAGWRRVDIPIDNKASGRKVKQKKVESVWMNY